MEKKQHPQRKEPRASREPQGSGPQPGAGTAIFDNWLENKLKSAYSSVLEEPIPDELLRLITQKLKD